MENQLFEATTSPLAEICAQIGLLSNSAGGFGSDFLIFACKTSKLTQKTICTKEFE